MNALLQGDRVHATQEVLHSDLAHVDEDDGVEECQAHPDEHDERRKAGELSRPWGRELGARTLSPLRRR